MIEGLESRRAMKPGGIFANKGGLRRCPPQTEARYGCEVLKASQETSVSFVVDVAGRPQDQESRFAVCGGVAQATRQRRAEAVGTPDSSAVTSLQVRALLHCDS